MRLPITLLTALAITGSATAATPDLTLKRVMLSSGGVGYFEYEAEIDGAAVLGLDVPLNEVDDVLKSLVVFDSEGGVGSIDLPGKEGSQAAFGDIPLDPSALQSPLAYLNGLQGIEVDVTGPRAMTGRILHADTVVTQPATSNTPPDAPVSRTRVSLLTHDGLRQFILEDADAVQVTDPKLRDGIGKALEELRRSSSHDQRHFTLHTSGTGRRIVRVGYVVGAPLWKTTYRLVLPEAGKDKATLQGWAVLENQSGVDWNGVELTLQSGNPVTFRQALYQSYFVDRPEVPVEVFNHILPQVDTRARPEPQGYAMRGMAQAKSFDALAAPAPMVPPVAAAASGMLARPEAIAETTEAEQEVMFRLPKPVVLPAGHTASVPLLDHEVPAESVDLVKRASTHPLAAVRIKNDTGAGLPPGVLTLYSAGAGTFFAGDARLGSLPTRESRLLSFAEDLRTTVDWQTSDAQTLGTLTAADGVLRVEEKQRHTGKITLTGPAAAPVKVLLDVDRGTDQTLSFEGDRPAGIEETADSWRVPYALKPGEIRTITLYVDEIEHQELRLLPESADQIIAYADQTGLSAPSRAALQSLAALRQAAAKQDQEKSRLEAVVGVIEADEKRVRDNLAAVPAGDSLHGRLTRQLEADEDRMAATRKDIDTAAVAVDKARRDLADAIANLRL